VALRLERVPEHGPQRILVFDEQDGRRRTHLGCSRRDGPLGAARATISAATREAPGPAAPLPRGRRWPSSSSRCRSSRGQLRERALALGLERRALRGVVPRGEVCPERVDAALEGLGEREWLSFRDVFEVNGRPVRDQQERLTDLFLQPFEDARRRAEEITRAASRHSMVELGGASNPLGVLAFLQAHYQPQYIFTLGSLDPKLGPTIRILDFEERVLPVPAARGTPIPIRGTAWVDETTGRVVKTELRIGTGAGTSIVRTVFGFDETLGIDVPVEMRETRPGPSTTSRPLGRAARLDDQFIGVATYGRFRRFQVQTNETLGVPEG
jgi:hypothetical protein